MGPYSAFQFGFCPGFQVIYPPAKPAPNGNKEYRPTSHELRHIERLNKIEQLKLKERVVKQDFKAKEIQIEDLELQRLKEGLADKELQAQLLQLLLEQQQIKLMQMQLEREIRFLILEDDALLILLLSSPF